MEGGKLTRLRALAASCQVAADTPIRTITGVSADESVAWLAGKVSSAPREEEGSRAGSGVGSGAIAAMAAHSGNAARDALNNIAKSDSDFKNRKNAIFW